MRGTCALRRSCDVVVCCFAGLASLSPAVCCLLRTYNLTAPRLVLLFLLAWYFVRCINASSEQELLRYRANAQTAAVETGVSVNLADSICSVVSGGSGGGGGGMWTGTGTCDPLSLKLLGARLPHGEALEIRLDFIGFVVSKSNLELTFALVETLWRDFLQKPLCGAYVPSF